MADAKPTPTVATADVPKMQPARRDVLRMFAGAFALAAGGPLLESCSGKKTRPDPYPQQMQRLLLPEWREAAAQFPGTEYQVLSNLRAFSELGEAMATSENGKAFLAGKRELTILYPGAGEHLSPIEFAMRLAGGAPNLDKVKLIYTEISQDCYDKIDTDVKAVVDSFPGRLSGFSVETKENCNPGKEKMMRFSYTTPFGTPVEIELLFALERGGEDGAYYRHEYFQSADILISHDSIGDEGALAPSLAVQMFAGSLDKDGGGSKDRVLLMEHGDQPYQRHMLYGGLGPADVVDAPFGCGPNHLERSKRKMLRTPFFNEAAAIYLDRGLFQELSAHGLMAAYARILTFAHSEFSEPSQLQAGVGRRTQEETDKCRAAYNSDLSAMLKALPAIGQAARAKVSKVLMDSISGNFNLDIFSDETLLPALRMVANDYLDPYKGYDINKAILDFMSFRSDNFLDLQSHMSTLLACYCAAYRAGDSALLARVGSVVQSELSNLDKKSISDILDVVASFRTMAEDPRSPGMASASGASLAFSQGGLFIVDARGIETPVGMTAGALMTLLYLANKLGCEGIEETKQFISEEVKKYPRAQAYGDWLCQAAS